jgi:hypothetical protein
MRNNRHDKTEGFYNLAIAGWLGMALAGAGVHFSSPWTQNSADVHLLREFELGWLDLGCAGLMLGVLQQASPSLKRITCVITFGLSLGLVVLHFQSALSVFSLNRHTLGFWVNGLYAVLVAVAFTIVSSTTSKQTAAGRESL